MKGKTIEEVALNVNNQITALEAQGKRVKVVQQSVAYGGFQAVAAGVKDNFITSHANQYPTICVTVEIE